MPRRSPRSAPRCGVAVCGCAPWSTCSRRWRRSASTTAASWSAEVTRCRRLGVNGTTFLDANIFSSQIDPGRTFCIFEEVGKMRGAGLIEGGSPENAMVCSMAGGWLNPPLWCVDEPCHHKILYLVGDFSLFAQNGNQGFPVAHIVAYKVPFPVTKGWPCPHLSGYITVDQEMLAEQGWNIRLVLFACC